VTTQLQLINIIIIIIIIIIFIILLYITVLQTFELYMQPLPHFTNNTDFIIQRPTAVCIFYNFNIL